MAAPNLVNIQSIYGRLVQAAPANITANSLISNAASSGLLLKLNSLVATNVTATAAVVTVSINNAAAGGGTAYRLAYQVTVPGNSSLVVVDKNSAHYLPENTSVVVTSGTSAAIEYVASYEEMA